MRLENVYARVWTDAYRRLAVAVLDDGRELSAAVGFVRARVRAWKGFCALRLSVDEQVAYVRALRYIYELKTIHGHVR